MITLTINGKEVKAKEGWTLLEVARQNGFEIPTLCHHQALTPSGACRLCVTEVDDGRRKRVVASCIYPVRQGIRVLTDTDRVHNVRRWVLEMLLAECPNAPVIQDLARQYGIEKSRFVSERSDQLCMLCGLCVRACKEIVGSTAIGFGNRGVRKEVTTPYHQPSAECVACGTCVTICPTGAMDSLLDQVRSNSI